MVDVENLLQIFDREQRINVPLQPGVHRDASPWLVRHYMPQYKTGFIAYSSMDDDRVDAEIETQVSFFDGLGYDFEWKVFDHDRPADLRQRLSARGFSIEDPEALMILDLEEAPEIYWTADISCVSPVNDRSGIDGIVSMEEEVWQSGRSWLGQRLFDDLQSVPDMLSIFVVRADDRVVSAAWVYYHAPTQFASLWGGSTLRAYRRRGYYTALLAARAREARSRGFRFLTVDASPMSRPILEKHGFRFFGFSTPCLWKATGNSGSAA